MAAPRFDRYHIDLDTMTVSHLGSVSAEELQKHPSGWMVVVLEDGTYMRTDLDPVWRKIKDGKETEITITTTAADRPANSVGYFDRSAKGLEDQEP